MVTRAIYRSADYFFHYKAIPISLESASSSSSTGCEKVG